MEDKGRELLEEVIKKAIPNCSREEAKRVLGEDCFLALETLAGDFRGEAAKYDMNIIPDFPLKVLKFGALVVSYFIHKEQVSTANEVK